MKKYEHQLLNKQYNIETRKTYTKKNGLKINQYCNDIMTFDIEVTSAWLNNGKVIGYRKGKDNEYWNNLTPLCLPYIWQFSFNQDVYYGRELRDFEKVLKDIPSDYQVVIWVHNLSYEFHFLNNIFEWESVFAKNPHKPMKCIPKKYPNIEFRCSYMLTRLSLDSWGKQLGVKKATGDLDYEVVRTPLTPLTNTELNYCEQDCVVLWNGIKSYRKRYGSVRDIPLTQTGTVRRVVKDLLMSNEDYVKHIKTLVPSDADEYRILMQLFSGGYTHANRMYSGVTQEGHIEHYDFASSYPTVMISEKYPNSKWVWISKQLPDESTFDDYAYMIKATFYNIECITLNTYIQSSKCVSVKPYNDNGRIIKAESITIVITEQDYLTIKETYRWERVEVDYCYRSKKEYLPKPFIEYILELYNNKTTLKDVPNMEDLYMQSKQYINSLFGMCVTAVVQPDVKFDGKNWTIGVLDDEIVNKKLDSLRHWRPREKRYFLSYSWGCWVPAYARRNLWKCIESCDADVIYCDTDSIFVNGKQNFNWYNEEITEKLKKACDYLNIDFSKTRPKTTKGKEKPLGIFCQEDVCTQLKTLGAKRYVERRKNDNELHLTVSGINKSAVALLNDNIENFEDGFNFDKDAECVHKQLATYVTDMPIVTYPDGYISTYKEGINMRRTGYLLTISDEYKRLIDIMSIDIEGVEEHVINRIKNIF